MTATRRSVLASGYIALDVVRAQDGTWLRAGGTAANVAAILGYLGWHAAVVGQIGDDDAGPIVELDLRSNGVDTSRLRLGAAGTPLVLHDIAPTGHRFRFGCASCGRVYRPHRPVSRTEVDQTLDAAVASDAFFFDRPTSVALHLAALYRESRRLVVYEPSSAGRVTAHERAINLADIVKFSEERRPQFAAALRRPVGGQTWIETRGERGARVYFQGSRFADVRSYPVRAVDAGGAGDWFTAGLISYFPIGPPRTRSDILRAARFGSALGALACLAPGARTIGELLAPSDLRALATALMRGSPVELAARRIRDTPRTGRCPDCRLPTPAAAAS